MIKTHPRSLGQRISLTLSTLVLVPLFFLTACGGGGGGGDTTQQPSNPSNPNPPVIASITSTGCAVKPGENSCLAPVSAVVPSGTSAVARVAITGKEVEVVSGSATVQVPVGAQVINLVDKASGASLAVTQVVINCSADADLVGNACVAKAPVYKDAGFAIGDRFATFYALSPTVATAVQNLTGEDIFNCGALKLQKDGEAKGSCTSVRYMDRFRVVISQDPVTKGYVLKIDGLMLGQPGFVPVNPDDYTYYTGDVQTLTLDGGTYSYSAESTDVIGKLFFQPQGGSKSVIYDAGTLGGFKVFFTAKLPQ